MTYTRNVTTYVEALSLKCTLPNNPHHMLVGFSGKALAAREFAVTTASDRARPHLAAVLPTQADHR
jgi:hypothetical protein